MEQFRLVGFHPVSPDNFAGSQDDSNVYTCMSPVLEINGFNYLPSCLEWKLEDLQLISEAPRYETKDSIMVDEGDNVSFAGKKFIHDAVFIVTTAGLNAEFVSPASNGWNETEKGLWQVEPYSVFADNSSALFKELDSWAGHSLILGGVSERFAFQAWGLVVRIFALWNHETMTRKIELLDFLGRSRDAESLRGING